MSNTELRNADGTRVLSTDLRPVVLPLALSDLTGPSSGRVELPQWLDWGPERHYDLGDDYERGHLYEIVLREATDPDELTAYLNQDLLRQLWPSLWLPHRVRARWEARFPELADR